jgi:hypothetical protein
MAGLACAGKLGCARLTPIILTRAVALVGAWRPNVSNTSGLTEVQDITANDDRFAEVLGDLETKGAAAK